MTELTLRIAQVGVHGSSQNGVHERQRPACAKDLGPDKPGCRHGRFLRIQFRERGSKCQLGFLPRIATARASASAGAPSRRIRCSTKRAIDSGPSSRTCSAALALGSTRPARAAHELVEQKRIARAGGVHGLHELRRGITRESCPEESRDCIEAEWSRTCERCERLGLQLVEDRCVRAGLARPNGGRDDDREPVESASDVREKAQRGRVAPVEVVDRKQHGCELGKIRGQPEEPVQRRIGDVRSADKRLAYLAELEERCREAGCADEERARSSSPHAARRGSNS